MIDTFWDEITIDFTHKHIIEEWTKITFNEESEDVDAASMYIKLKLLKIFSSKNCDNIVWDFRIFYSLLLCCFKII